MLLEVQPVIQENIMAAVSKNTVIVIGFINTSAVVILRLLYIRVTKRGNVTKFSSKLAARRQRKARPEI